tara:strand:+ start:254 stop:454 length:201 start_codon:yes stop_codon:yes gene_type:complete
MNNFMFHSFEFIRTDEICIFGAWGDYSVEVTINSKGVEVCLPDYDAKDPNTVTNIKKIFKDEFINE